jgi:D-glycero-D-manno-heptose 1,7-bisphosphate phosphatase
MMKVVVLDGDGVINNIAAHDIQSAAEWKPLPGSLEAIAKLCQGGCRVFIAANYGGIGRGLLDYDTLFAMFERLQKLVSEMGGRIDGIFFAPEHPDQASEMRKPNPGMLQDLARRLQLNLDEMVMVGAAPATWTPRSPRACGRCWYAPARAAAPRPSIISGV